MTYGTAKNSKGLSSEGPSCSWKEGMSSPMTVGLAKTEPGTSKPYKVHPCLHQCLKPLSRRASQRPFSPCWNILIASPSLYLYPVASDLSLGRISLGVALAICSQIRWFLPAFRSLKWEQNSLHLKTGPNSVCYVEHPLFYIDVVLSSLITCGSIFTCPLWPWSVHHCLYSQLKLADPFLQAQLSFSTRSGPTPGRRGLSTVSSKPLTLIVISLYLIQLSLIFLPAVGLWVAPHTTSYPPYILVLKSKISSHSPCLDILEISRNLLSIPIDIKRPLGQGLCFALARHGACYSEGPPGPQAALDTSAPDYLATLGSLIEPDVRTSPKVTTYRPAWEVGCDSPSMPILKPALYS